MRRYRIEMRDRTRGEAAVPNEIDVRFAAGFVLDILMLR